MCDKEPGDMWEETTGGIKWHCCQGSAGHFSFRDKHDAVEMSLKFKSNARQNDLLALPVGLIRGVA
jgi:hypothetical protein